MQLESIVFLWGHFTCLPLVFLPALIEHLRILIEVIDSHKQEDIIEALKQQPLELREQVEEVSVDMWGGFPRIGGRSFPFC